MLAVKSKYIEEAHIGEELFQDKAYELERQCMTVQNTVQRKVFSLAEALEAYGVSNEDFENYLAKTITEKYLNTITPKMYLRVVKKKFHHGLGNEHPKEVARVDKSLDQLTGELEA